MPRKLRKYNIVMIILFYLLKFLRKLISLYLLKLITLN